MLGNSRALVEQFGDSEAHKARTAHRRSGGVYQPLEGAYKNSAGLVRKELEEGWDIEARELELAESIARSQKHTSPAPTHRRNQLAVAPSPAVVRPEEIVL